MKKIGYSSRCTAVVNSKQCWTMNINLHKVQMLGDAGNGVSCDKSISSHPETIKYVKSEHFRFLTWHFLFMLHFDQRFFLSLLTKAMCIG